MFLISLRVEFRQKNKTFKEHHGARLRVLIFAIFVVFSTIRKKIFKPKEFKPKFSNGEIYKWKSYVKYYGLEQTSNLSRI